MKGNESINNWIKRARSNLARAEAGKISPDILYEDLCFDIQQSVEKILKTVCIKNDIIFPRTHNIEYLIELLEKGNVKIPDKLLYAKILTDYAVETRYPGDYEPVDEDEYLTALKIGKEIMKWFDTFFKN